MSDAMGDGTADGAGVTDGAGRCPECGARVVATQEWCGLCHRPLRGASSAAGPDAPDDAFAETGPGVPPAAGDPAVDPGAGLGDTAGVRRTLDPLGQPVEDIAPVAGPGPGQVDPRVTDAQADAAADARAASQADAMLAELAMTSASERPGARGPLAHLPRPVRIGLGCGAALLLVLVLLVVGGLVGSLL